MDGHLLGPGKARAEEAHEEGEGQEGGKTGQESEEVQEGDLGFGLCFLGVGRQLRRLVVRIRGG